MAIWSARQLQQVQQASSRAHVSHEVMERGGGAVLSATRSRLVREFRAFCLPFVVEIHPSDIRFRQEPAETAPFTEQITAYWRPETTEVQFFGGPADGDVRSIQQAGDSVRIAVEPGIDWRNPPTAPEPVTLNVVTYSLAGWDETARRWVYRSA